VPSDIKGGAGRGMSAADVEDLFRVMCLHCHAGLDGLVSMLTDALNDEAITQIEAASAAKAGLMREMRNSVATGFESTQLSALQDLDGRVASAGRGPLYFNLVVIFYRLWSEECRANLSSDESVSSTQDSDEDLTDIPPTTMRRTGVVHVDTQTHAGMDALLAALSVFSVT
jgi:hypothetical protein